MDPNHKYVGRAELDLQTMLVKGGVPLDVIANIRCSMPTMYALTKHSSEHDYTDPHCYAVTFCLCSGYKASR
jgi:hypothetical protein